MMQGGKCGGTGTQRAKARKRFDCGASRIQQPARGHDVFEQPCHGPHRYTAYAVFTLQPECLS